MLNNKNLLKLAETIRNEFPYESKDFVDAFEWLSLAIDGVLSKIGSDLKIMHQAGDYEKISNFIELSKNISLIQRDLKSYSDYFITQSEEDEESQEELLDLEIDEDDVASSPDYKAYSVNNTIPHTLYEDYKFTKACGFELDGIKYDARNMRDVLVQSCALLAKIDIAKLNSFIDDPTMKGRKVSYFGTEEVVEDFTVKNEKIPETDIYVWVNLSCNHIRNIIKKMLKKYGISFNDFKIFLRADYKKLHNSESKAIDNTPPAGEEKIGKYVANCMAKLSKEQHHFSDNDLIAMQSGKWCKDVLGIYSPLIKKYDDTLDKTSQVLINGYPRYWKELYSFNGEEYFVTSQWYERHREKFNEWIRRIK